MVWTDFSSIGTVILTTSSANQGATWRRALALSSTSEGFVWLSQNTVATNGDVYVSYHSQTGWTSGGSPDGVSGKTTGLIVGEEPGASKVSKAQKAGVPLLTESDLDDLLRG